MFITTIWRPTRNEEFSQEEHNVHHQWNQLLRTNSQRTAIGLVHVDGPLFHLWSREQVFVTMFWIMNRDSLNKLWKPLLSCPSFTKELKSIKELVCKDCWLIMKSMKSNISEDTYLSYLVLLSDTLSSLNEFVQSYDQVCYDSTDSKRSSPFVIWSPLWKSWVWTIRLQSLSISLLFSSVFMLTSIMSRSLIPV